MNVEKLKEVFAEEAFVKALFEMGTVEEVQKALTEKGVELSQEDAAGIYDFFAKIKSGDISREQLEQWSTLAQKGELTEEALEQVAGGCAFTLLSVAATIIVGLVFICSIVEPV